MTLAKSLRSQVSLLAALSLLVHSLGFMTSRAFTSTLRLPEAFFPETTSTYFVWGAKVLAFVLGFVTFTVIGLAVLAVVFATLSAVARIVLRPFRGPLQPLEKWWDTIVGRAQRSMTRERLAVLLFLANLCALIAFYILFQPLIDAYLDVNYPNLPSPADLAVLGTANRVMHEGPGSRMQHSSVPSPHSCSISSCSRFHIDCSFTTRGSTCRSAI